MILEEVKKEVKKRDFYLIIYGLIKTGLNLKEISFRLNLSKQGINYYVSSLKREGLIRKVGYGTWEIANETNETSKNLPLKIPSKEVKKIPRLAKSQSVNFKPNTIRGHAFVFKLKLPSLKNWEKRKEYFNAHHIEYKQLHIFGGAEQIIFKGRKVQLTNKSIIVYEKASYFAETSDNAQSYAIYDFKQLITSLESFLGTDFKIKGQYLFKVRRKHYALIKNALAQQYNGDNKKLNVYNKEGTLWFIIDDSFNLNEAEIINTASKDITQEQSSNRIQAFFNGIPKYEGFTPEFVVNSIGELTKNSHEYSSHIASHVQAIKDLGSGIREFNEKIRQSNDNSMKQSAIIQKIMELLEQLAKK